jgi:uncharacterized protein DUF1707
MSFGAGYGNDPGSGGMLASEADREATQAVLKQAYEDERLTLDEFESRVGRAVAARTQGELAKLTRDIPAPPAGPVPGGPVPDGPRFNRSWLLIGGIIAVVGIGLVVGLVQAFSSMAKQEQGGTSAAGPAGSASNPGPPSTGPAGCPVGTSPTALAIANALARDPVYVDPAASLLTPAQAQRLRAEIGSDDSGRIRLAAVAPATVRTGGGERALANAISSCSATSAGVTVVSTATSTYLVTSYTGYQATSQAVGAALNTHASLAAGLKDAVKRMATLDPAKS